MSTARARKAVKRFALNAAGRDLAVGDIHGHFSRLEEALSVVGFDVRCDRLFSVGDLVDRGPESLVAIEYLKKPWFHAVRGNHDDYAVRYRTCNMENWFSIGGDWFAGVSEEDRATVSEALASLPFAIEVETPNGLVGIVHADCPFSSWSGLIESLESPESASAFRRTSNSLMFSRERFRTSNSDLVEGVSAVVCGHSTVPSPLVLGNVFHIDTGGWTEGGRFTVLELGSLACG